MVYINFVCNHEGCKQCQSANFDTVKETWGDMLAAIQDAGWKLDLEDAKVINAICPDHK